MTEDCEATLFKLFDFMNFLDDGSFRIIEKYGKRSAISKWTHNLGGSIVTVVFLDGNTDFLIRTPQWSIEMIDPLTFDADRYLRNFKGSKKAFLRDMTYAKFSLVD
jgi:hypothetical protein